MSNLRFLAAAEQIICTRVGIIILIFIGFKCPVSQIWDTSTPLKCFCFIFSTPKVLFFLRKHLIITYYWLVPIYMFSVNAYLYNVQIPGADAMSILTM